MSRKNLSKAIVLSLLLGSVCGVAQAENIMTSPQSYFRKSVDGGPYDGINITLDTGTDGTVYIDGKRFSSAGTAIGVRNNYEFKMNGNNVYVHSKYVLKNGSKPINTNNALWVSGKDKNKVDITAKQVLIAATEVEKADAISAKNGGTAMINPTPVDGGYTQIIGDIDFVENDLHHDWEYYNQKKNKPELTADGSIELTLNNKKSFWYGDEENTYEEFKDKVFKTWDEFAEQYPQYADYLIKKSVYSGKTTEERMKKLEDIQISGHGDLNLTISNGAEWIYKKNPTISKITLKDGGIVNIQDNPADGELSVKDKLSSIKVTNPFDNTTKTLSVIDFSGRHDCVDIRELNGDGGIFKVDLKFNDESKKPIYNIADANEKRDSDYIFIGKGSGTHDVQFNSKVANLDKMQPNADPTKEDRLYFANVADADSGIVLDSSTVKALTQEKIEDADKIYVHKYEVKSEKVADASSNASTSKKAVKKAPATTTAGGSGTNWYIHKTEDVEEKEKPGPKPEPTPGPKPEPTPEPKPSEAFKVIEDVQYANYALGTELDRLNKRMGEARYVDGKDHGIWARIKRTRQGIDNAFENNYTMYQVGNTARIHDKNDQGKHYRGVALDYIKGKSNLTRVNGTGDNERVSGSAFDTWLGEKGHYRDIVVRFGRIRNSYDIGNSQGKEMSADYHNNFGSISLEYGRKKDMQKGWYIEPQSQLQVARIGSASYHTKQGIFNHQDAITSIIGRLGFRLGYENAAKTRNYYFKADVMHEFDGDRAITASDKYGYSLRKDYDGQRTWGDVGVGADIKTGKDSYFWLDLERSFGSGISRTWQINGGFSWQWR